VIKEPHFYAVIIGSEILNRRREDKHFDFLTKALQAKGFELFASFIIKDDVKLIEQTYTLIKNDPGVDDCVVLALPETGGREHRISVLIQGGTVKAEKIKKTLAASLESYALPRRIKIVGRIPVNKNGKYDWQTITRLLEK